MTTATSFIPENMSKIRTNAISGIFKFYLNYSAFQGLSKTIIHSYNEDKSMTKSDEKKLTFRFINYRQEAFNLFSESREFTPKERIAYKEGVLKSYKRTGRNITDLL